MKSNIEFKDNRVAIKAEINEKSLNLIEAIAKEINTQVIKNSKVDTGQTKQYWKHYIERQKGEAYVGNELENALWEEFGTGEYAVNGDGRKTPWFVPVDGYTGTKKPTFNGKVEVVFIKGVKYYKTNGKKPSRALTKAFETTKPKITKMAEKTFGGFGK